jgi:flavin prenyltransferase
MDTSSPNRLILALTGASGAVYGVRALEMLKQAGVEVHLVISHAAQLTLRKETGRSGEDLLELADYHYSPDDLAAPIASGSFITRGMLVLPCSIKTLSAVANSYNADLITRAADVCLKEGRPLVLGVREAPFHRGHLRLMDLAARAGAVIYPPIPHFYGNPASIGDLVTQTVGRILQRMGIENPGYVRWGEESS